MMRMMNLSASCLPEIQTWEKRHTIICSFTPVWNLRVCLKYRKKNAVIYLRKAIELVDAQIEFVRWQMQMENTASYCPLAKHLEHGKLQWTGSIVAWVELIYAIHASGHINNGKASLKKIFAVMGETFVFEVEEFSRVFIDIKNRVKGDRTAFLDELKQALMRIMEEADRKPSRK